MSNGYTFTKRSAERITRVVRDVERGGRDQPPVYFRRFGDDGPYIRLGTISTTWSKGSTATVTQINGDGSDTDEPITFDAKNWFATVTVSAGTKKVACALVDTVWILIAAEC